MAFAGTITGTVTNGTNGKPSAGDKVSLLSLSAALDEVGTAKTDGQGHFTLNTPSDAPYLIKVEHQKGAYFKNVPPGTAQVAISVYDVAARVEGVSTEADVIRLEAENGQLKVTENYFVKNTSSPPRTQSSSYEVAIPADAVLEGAATTGPSNMPIAATPDPAGPKGHYAFTFPIRPNEGERGTRFQLTYHIPYTGSYTFSPKLMTAADNVAVLLPKGMKFASQASYQPIMDDPSAQTFLVKNAVAGQALDFTVSGTGSMPRDDQPGQATGPANGPGSGGADAAATQGGPGGTPGGGLGNPIDTPDPLDKYKWWILGGVALLLAAGAAYLMRKPVGAGETTPEPAAKPTAGQGAAISTPVARSKGQSLLDALKEELFVLESEKIAGTISPEEYTEAKAALEIVLRRALGRP